MQIKTHPKFWDCECDSNYIHRKAECLVCKKCGADEDEMPDSRVNELIEQGFITEEEGNSFDKSPRKEEGKNLDEIFSEEDVLQIVEWAHGRKPGKIFHINLISLNPEGFEDWPDYQKYNYLERYGNRNQELEVSFNYQGSKDDFANLRLTISNTGQVEYATWSDCGCRIEKPLHVYRLVMQRFEEAGLLEEVMGEVAANG